MKFIYIANIRLPTEKAHGIQIMKMCEAFTEAGAEVELVVPWRHNDIIDDPFHYYRVKKLFNISYAFSLDLVSFGRVGFLVQSLTFSLAVLWRFFRTCLESNDFLKQQHIERKTSWSPSRIGIRRGRSEVLQPIFCYFRSQAVSLISILRLDSKQVLGIWRQKKIVFYSRDEMPAYFLSLLGVDVVWETHMGHDNFFIRSLIRRDVPIVCISGGLRDFYLSHGAKKVLVSPDGVDIEQFQIKESREEARDKLGLPKEVKLVVYTGHLYPWKGADVLAEAARGLAEDTYTVFVGGTEKDVESFKNKYGEIRNIIILGNKPHHKIPMYLRAADVLVIPNSAKEKISRLYTSPMKLFEYMASGTPIVASGLPSLREIIDDSLAYFFIPDDSKSLCGAIIKTLGDYAVAKKKGDSAIIFAENYSWQKRVQNILDFIKIQL